MIKERGVSYYGVAYPDRAKLDFEEMVDHGCNAVLLAISEFDWWFWHENVIKLVKLARGCGLKPYVDLWGWGKTMAGEAPSIFLMQSLEGRQKAVSGKPYSAMCINYKPFREHLKNNVEMLIEETELEGLFWDEPHYANWHDADWACTCPICKRMFMEETGEEMPTVLTEEVVRFREDHAVSFLRELSQKVKQVNEDIKVITCLLPTKSSLIGITDWEKVASIPEIDVLGTDPYYFHTDMNRKEGLSFFREQSQQCLSLAEKHHKLSQLWLMAFKVPAGRENELREAADIAAELGVDSLFAWPYRGAMGSYMSSANPSRVWSVIGETYRRHSV